jgi:AcrR family transcriptional regulator
MNDQEKLVRTATELYLRYGVKSVSMDDISRELGISKKTLYQYVENKRDLVQKVMASHLNSEKCMMEEIRGEARDAVEEMVLIARYVLSIFKQVSPGTMYDLKKYYRKVWDEWEVFHKEHIFKAIRQNLINGIDQGLYREKMNPDIVARLYVAKASVITDEEIFPPSMFKREELFLQYVHYHMHGILSNVGKEKFMEYINQSENQLI